MKKIVSLILGSIVAFTLTMSAAFSAANEVRVAFFLEWATPNQEAKVKKVFDDALGVPVKWTNFATGGEMTEAMLSGDIDISYSQGLTPFVMPDALDTTQVVPPIPYVTAISTSLIGALALTAFTNGVNPCE